MDDTKTRIARNLDTQFASMGFAAPGVDSLRDGADVSLRTLYKYYPSRDAMVVGALEHRNTAYLDWISGGPETGIEHVLHIFNQLGAWLENVANTGCLFINALAAYPNDPEIRAVAERHKDAVRQVFADRVEKISPASDITMLAEALLSIHEGQTNMAMIRGAEAAQITALHLAQTLLQNEGIQ
ncbi:TetR/AcrR family transcriptional regulator [Cochlodiniinecator piscidefendens]|uniref:TetR/AcrR family transcriptional regulator n=1 Tax=Cochlodiniinecator piscidefendens TaxID=2715756 RepID=UPI00140BB9CC|nr:TetR/AcrR family transcriptional regulator [Cochlodiniinecator piscidefendens]